MGLNHYKQMRDFMATNKRKSRWDEEKEIVEKDKSILEEVFEEDEFVSEESDEPIN